MGFSNRSENEIMTALAALGRDKDAWADALGQLPALLDHKSARVRQKALWLLGEMGLLHPDLAAPCVPRIAALLADGDARTRERAVGALGRIGRGDLAPVMSYLGNMLALARDDAAPVRMNCIWAAENIATNHPEAYEGAMGLFATLLDDEAIRVRIEAPEIFRVIGKRRPEMVYPYLEKLSHMAAHDEDRVVRIHAAGAVRAATQKGPSDDSP